MSVRVVVGAQWGDEGKGKLVDVLSKDVDIVARYQGGANAGHTIEIGDQKYILHLIPSGIFNEHCISVIGNGVVIDPVALLQEIRFLEEQGVSLKGRLKISHNAHLIMPYHKLLDSLYEKGNKPIGTTGRGIGPAYYDKAARVGIRIVDLLDHDILEERIRRNIEDKNLILSKIYDAEQLDVDKILEEYMLFDQQIDEYVTDTAHYLNYAIRDGKKVLCEGAQGALLDLDHGTYPYVTSSSPISGGATIGLGIPPTAISSVVGVMKAYTTRVGHGPFPTELLDAIGDQLRDQGHEYGSTTGRPRRCGWFDAVAMRYSAMLNGITSCGMTKLDVLSGLDEIKICVGYEFDGKRSDHFQTNLKTLDQLTPVYESFPGWQEDISAITSFDKLPDAARSYITAVERIIDTRIACVSVGPERTQILFPGDTPQW
jgi:adenylosuccinate synthase